MKEARYSIHHQFKITTLKNKKGSEVSLCPERGGVITSIKIKGRELLYLDLESFNDLKQNVRGGIPILFPNAGLLDEKGPYPLLKQHGFARTSDKWSIEKAEGEEFIEKIKSDTDTRKLFPYDFLLRIRMKIENNNSVSLIQEVTNLNEKKVMPISMGMHPYFKVRNEDKEKIEFDFEGGDYIKNDFENWSNGGTTRIDNPKIKDSEAILRIKIPEFGTLAMDVSKEYKRIWAWTQPGKDFICIEPMMRNQGGLTDDPELVKAGDTFSAKVNFNFYG